MISAIIKVEVSVISRCELKAEADNTYRDLDYSDITKTESNNCFITHCFEMNNDKHTVAWNRFELPSEIMHCACILQISRLRLFPKLSVGS